ncbi:MAG: FAD-dependent oxidoreductase [Rhizonema sp. PD37]|nr:FAD-dependent oxidoreductase [Rhizonema sp. PD37]
MNWSQQDPDIAIALQTLVEQDGIEFLPKALRVDTLVMKLSFKSKLLIVKSSSRGRICFAVGRAPNTDSSNLAAASVATDTCGFIQVKDHLETNIPGIWALGDINAGSQCTQMSLNDYRIIKANLIDEGNHSTRDRLVPSCLFIDPELAHVGLTDLCVIVFCLFVKHKGS